MRFLPNEFLAATDLMYRDAGLLCQREASDPVDRIALCLRRQFGRRRGALAAKVASFTLHFATA